jgi:hypothetical protein
MFLNLQPGETTRQIIHKHWFVFLLEALGLLILFLLPVIILPVMAAFVSQGGLPVGVSGPAILMALSAWALVMWCKFFGAWTDWYFDVWIVTNQRIIDIDQRGFFNRDVATLLTVDKVEDITVVVKGFFPTLLDYGYVQVQTAAAKVEFTMNDVGNPHRIERLIRALRAERQTALKKTGVHDEH